MSTTIDALRNLGLKVNGEEPQSNYVNNVINEIADNYSPTEAGMSNPMTTAGDIIVGGTSGAPTRLAKGTQGQVLSVGSTGLEWTDASGGSGESIYTFDFSGATEYASEDESITTYTLNITSAQASELSGQAAIDLILPDDLLAILMNTNLTVIKGYGGFVGGAIVDSNQLVTANLIITSSAAMLNVVTTTLSSGGDETKSYEYTFGKTIAEFKGSDVPRGNTTPAYLGCIDGSFDKLENVLMFSVSNNINNYTYSVNDSISLLPSGNTSGTAVNVTLPDGTSVSLTDYKAIRADTLTASYKLKLYFYTDNTKTNQGTNKYSYNSGAKTYFWINSNWNTSGNAPSDFNVHGYRLSVCSDVPYILSHNFPTAPTSNGTYVLKCTVSSGTATYSWVAE